MDENIEAHFNRFKKREKRLKGTTLSLSLIPFIAGAAWMYFSWREVSHLNADIKNLTNQKQQAQQDLKTISDSAATLIKLRDSLEQDLTQSYEHIGSNMTQGNPQHLLDRKAQVAIQRVELGKVRSTVPILINYYYQSIKDAEQISLLQRMGYKVQVKKSVNTQVNDINCLWYGGNVQKKDVQQIAIALIGSGKKIKKIIPYVKQINRPGYKANVIEVGGLRNLVRVDILPLTIDQVEKGEF